MPSLLDNSSLLSVDENRTYQFSGPTTADQGQARFDGALVPTNASH
jgi:hypothetical protein